VVWINQPVLIMEPVSPELSEVQIPNSSAELEPLSVTVMQAKRLSGLGLSKIWQLIGDGRLESKRLDGRRMISYASLKRLLLEA
jgi:hypothetical protein